MLSLSEMQISKLSRAELDGILVAMARPCWQQDLQAHFRHMHPERLQRAQKHATRFCLSTARPTDRQHWARPSGTRCRSTARPDRARGDFAWPRGRVVRIVCPWRRRSDLYAPGRARICSQCRGETRFTAHRRGVGRARGRTGVLDLLPARSALPNRWVFGNERQGSLRQLQSRQRSLQTVFVVGTGAVQVRRELVVEHWPAVQRRSRSLRRWSRTRLAHGPAHRSAQHKPRGSSP